MLFSDRRLLLPFALVDLFTPPALLWVIYLSPFVDAGTFTPYLLTGLISGIIVLARTYLQQGYQSFTQMTLTQKLAITFNSWLLGALFILLALFLLQNSYEISRALIIGWIIITPLSILLIKLLVIHTFKTIKRPKIKVLFLGRHYQFNKHERHYLRKHRVQICFASVAELMPVIETFHPDHIVINLEHPPASELVQRLTHLEINGLSFLSVNQFMERFLRKCYIPLNHNSLDYLNDIRPFTYTQQTWKKLIDISGSLFLILVTWPLGLFAVITIRVQSPGPILFRQNRIGLGGRTIQIIKFRTMHLHSDSSPYTEPDDSRVFPFGRFMRKARIDELPQLWNILKGDMHLIGPRAEWTLLVDQYQDKIAYYHERHIIKPGISGWAQVMYPYGRNTEDARQKLMYDLYYIKNWSLWLEIETAIKTLRVIFAQKGL
ncbi:MAG: exopolysaccharide biosynthesis polyprenyl glycosylphosphotransferase [Hydrogenovibrio sp.]|uniref:exopolysaccharide biosynthesis polyprenyl glycosylphosphotransferase n=1 Tax=Hydrogenovibrio sp. TaxID=2065821 RepID=UPI00286FD89B|nr:exopolysaccharide biosynthesis polyprenyl glycosylphosphotransferase [Hydrogenovibrio sp.]MDR9499909.1 exopolysaccharide biosynthesis polyprenyl glycosylphosphotransferase [Hydrogenovibrio sp.]